MRQGHTQSAGFTRVELLAVLSTVVLMLTIALPAISHAREESRAAQCGANLARIGGAYALWAADNGGFFPPRCRTVTEKCRFTRTCVGFRGEDCEDLPYAGSYQNAVRIVGNSPVRMDAPAVPTPGNPDHYIGADDRPLNRYIVPNWQCGRRFDATRCPADVNSLKAPLTNPYPKGLPRNAIGSGFDIHGTSYGTNVEAYMPWRGHGRWSMAVEVANNPQTGPDFNPQRFYGAARYVMMLDFASFCENWEEWLDMFEVGDRSGVGAWHESAPADTWQHGNALFGDNHVAYGAYYVPKARSPLSPINDYVKAEWSLYPLRYVPQHP